MVHTELLHQRFVIYLLRKIRYSCRMRTHEVHNTQRTTTHLDTSSDTLFQWHSSSYWVAPQFWSVDSWIFILIEYSAHTPCVDAERLHFRHNSKHITSHSHANSQLVTSRFRSADNRVFVLTKFLWHKTVPDHLITDRRTELRIIAFSRFKYVFG